MVWQRSFSEDCSAGEVLESMARETGTSATVILPKGYILGLSDLHLSLKKLAEEAVAIEKRVDPKDGRCYTKREFFMYYGSREGREVWDAAQKYQSAAASDACALTGILSNDFSGAFTGRSRSPTLLRATQAAAETAAAAEQQPESTEVEVEEHEMTEALRVSETEALEQESQDIAKAVLLSKADVRNADGVVLVRLEFHNPHVSALLRRADQLSDCVASVEAAGCDCSPSWAKGAILLVPATEEQICEAGINLQPHNVLILQSDVEKLKEALHGLPRRKRPRVKPECCADGGFSGEGQPDAEGASDCEPAEPSAHQVAAPQAQLIIERTFFNFPMSPDISSASQAMQSAPEGAGAGRGPVNPHRWPLPL